MDTPAKLAVFGVGLVAAFGAAAAETSPAAHDMTAGDTGHGDGAAHGEDAAHLPGGLAASEDGYTLTLDSPALPAGEDVPLAFRILDADGHAVTDYAVRHDQELHLIAVRRDLAGYQHVHPELDADGVWRVPLDLSPGSWRVFADFAATSDGTDRTLGADVQVVGDYAPGPLPAATRTALVDGYEVTLDGDLVAGEESELTLSVSRGGTPVTDLQPYLGAYGHLVALRTGDLAYLHVHPTGEPGDGETPAGPGITFATTTPSAGSYRLFLDFRHGDVVRTAAFTVPVEAHEEHDS